jgi:TRAP-type uncharacterized transport system substrate-binding protein
MKVILTLLMFLFCQPALALTIATGTPEGTYYQIAQDIKRIAEKEGIPVEIIQTNGSFDNINLLGLEKVDLAILQLDVLKVTSDAMQAKASCHYKERRHSLAVSVGREKGRRRTRKEWIGLDDRSFACRL